MMFSAAHRPDWCATDPSCGNGALPSSPEEAPERVRVLTLAGIPFLAALLLRVTIAG
jgi:hypothetical protein